MKITRKGEIKDGIYTVSLKFKSYGGDNLTSAQEEALIDNWAPKFEMKDVTFSEKLNLASGGAVVVDSASGEQVSFTLPNRNVLINNELELVYTLALKDIKDTSLGTIFDSKIKYAKACCFLFETKLIDKIKEVLEEYAPNLDEFEEDVEYTID